MADSWEQVVSVDEYYDGPRTGTADYRGRLHAFRSLYLDSGEWNPEENRFELTPIVDGAPAGACVVVRGEFRVRKPVPDLPAGVIRPLEVRWFPPD